MFEGVRSDLIVPLAGVDIDRMLAFWRWLIPETHRPLFATAEDEIGGTLQDAKTAVREAAAGDYCHASGLAQAAVQMIVTVRDREAWKRDCRLVGREPAWVPFGEACDLACRIDCFLATQEQGDEGGRLARASRENLDGLLIFADWCDENGRPAAAAEARHLHGLVRFLR